MAYDETPVDQAGKEDWHSSGAPFLSFDGPEGKKAIRFVSDKPERHESKFFNQKGQKKTNWRFDVEEFVEGAWEPRLFTMGSRQMRDAFTRFDKKGGLLNRYFGIEWKGLGVDRKYSVFECEAPK